MIVLPSTIGETIRERAHEGQPNEICGILGGAYEPEGTSRVHSQYPADNVAANPRTRYEIDPEQQLAIFDRLEDHGEEIVGFYHSHPRGPPRPSETDAQLATWPNRSYLIVSLEPPEIGSWRWRADPERDGDESAAGGRFERERLVVD
ncbi:desampylase [Natrinema sp. HArc-T2]|uniref:desampylase n=1 Tax=Natrinema sp. HArc-T2 TaxID=3242701 RepID=UPI00359DE3ED